MRCQNAKVRSSNTIGTIGIDGGSSYERVERLVALGDADVVAIKDVDGPVAVLVIFKMNSLSLVFSVLFLFFFYFSISQSGGD